MSIQQDVVVLRFAGNTCRLSTSRLFLFFAFVLLGSGTGVFAILFLSSFYLFLFVVCFVLSVSLFIVVC